jgi:hypothetical protein
MLAEIDITEQLKDPGFVQWLIYAYLGLTLWEKISGLIQKRKAQEVKVVGGEVEVSSKADFADKKRTEAAIEDVRKKLEALSETLAMQHKAALKAGEDRVRNLGEVMDAETAEIKTAISHMGDKMERFTEALHEKVNTVANGLAGANAKIEVLMASDFISRNHHERTGKR